MADYRDDFVKYIHVVKEQDNVWLAYVFAKVPYEDWLDDPRDDAEFPDHIDIWAAMDEVVLLSRVKREYSAIVIGHTDGVVEHIPY